MKRRSLKTHGYCREELAMKKVGKRKVCFHIRADINIGFNIPPVKAMIGQVWL